jgi:transglutaminase-like putative cysteine protease
VSFGDHSLYLRPRDSYGRTVTSFDLTTLPESTGRWVTDVEGNLIRVCGFGLNTSAVLEFDLHMGMEIEEDNPFDFILAPEATGFPFTYSESDRQALWPYMDDNGPGEALNWFREGGTAPGQHGDLVQFLADMNVHVHRSTGYLRRDEEGIQSPGETIRFGSGSCRDMAVLFMQGVKELGLAARFVSGYLYDPPDGDGHMYNRAVGSMHAWTEVYLPGAGWKGFDPTNGILANGFFIPSAVSYDPRRVDPVQGAYYSKQLSSSQLEVDLLITEVTP